MSKDSFVVLALALAGIAACRETSASGVAERSQDAAPPAASVARKDAPVASPAVVPEAAPIDPDPCEGSTTVVGTSISADQARSTATLSEEGGMVRTVRVGDRVGAMLVWYIEQDRVWMEFEHELCPFRRAQASPGASDRSLAELVASISPRIHKNSDFDYTLDRSAVAEILEHQGRLLREVRVVPERLDGSVAGIRLFGIRPDSLLGQLGFANGDRVESINGIRTDGSTEAFRKARRANRWTVAVVRSGRPIELTTHTR